MPKRILMLFALLLPHSVFAGEVPMELFGVTLGMTTTRTQDNPAGELAVKRLTGLVPWSRGARYYYEPEQKSEDFPYLEYKKGEEQSYPTNHSSLVLPVIPAEVKTIEEWQEHASKHGEQFTVMTVAYTSQEYDSVRIAYLAASALCQDNIDKLALEPARELDSSTSDGTDFKRTCIFVTDNRELEITQNGPKFVYRLKFSDEYVKNAEKTVEDKVSEMQPDTTTAMSE